MSIVKVLSPELFNTVRKDVARHIRKKLKAMEIDVTDLELHNSSLTKTLRAYVTLSRTTNLKALYLAEQMICKELHQEFGLHPHAFYWRYLPEEKAADDSSAPTVSAS
ncbi:hypothetical protein [Massilia glaciei]|uniref:Ribosome-binding factor A n=1 Tax=Massilia glaciei TaxID=1524097 RepID=A0A2U2HBW3_9BURK|nr:hypothetical protein [Massilia glaciei]PWF40343.1 hypothetical protein C7C56_026250 [Massilia glaciei]